MLSARGCVLHTQLLWVNLMNTKETHVNRSSNSMALRQTNPRFHYPNIYPITMKIQLNAMSNRTPTPNHKPTFIQMGFDIF